MIIDKKQQTCRCLSAPPPTGARPNKANNYRVGRDTLLGDTDDADSNDETPSLDCEAYPSLASAFSWTCKEPAIANPVYKKRNDWSK